LALSIVPFASGCSLDQMGSAPTVPGTHSPDGVTGTDGSEDPATAVPAEADASTPDDTSCAIEGRFALRADLAVSWLGSSLAGAIPIIDPGTGGISFVVLAEISGSGSERKAIVRNCDAQTPDFVSTTAGIGTATPQSYGVTFETAMWDAADMPRWPTTVSLACETTGCAIKFARVAALLGLTLADPNQAWPEKANDPAFLWKDHDEDGELGLTVPTLGPTAQTDKGLPYSHPPVGLLFSDVATKLALGMRVMAAFEGVLKDCDHLSGAVPMTHVDARVRACTKAASGACSSEEAEFIDGNLPIWTVTNGTFSGVRLADDADCKAARAAVH
jgi:hypothetical protein